MSSTSDAAAGTAKISLTGIQPTVLLSTINRRNAGVWVSDPFPGGDQ